MCSLNFISGSLFSQKNSMEPSLVFHDIKGNEISNGLAVICIFVIYSGNDEGNVIYSITPSLALIKETIF